MAPEVEAEFNAANKEEFPRSFLGKLRWKQ